MIKFFRKIRQQMINEGKTSQYLKYAIGEIILVVIGILIALGANSKMEQVKKQEAAYISIQNLREDLQKDVNQLKLYWMPRQKKQSDARNRLSTFLEDDTVLINDSIQFIKDVILLSTYYTFNPNKSAMEDLINNGGLGLIKDKTLLNNLLNYKINIENINEFDIIQRAYFLELFGNLNAKIVGGLLMQEDLTPDDELSAAKIKIAASKVLNANSIRSNGHLRELLIATGKPLSVKHSNYISLESKATKLLELIDNTLNSNN
jgi:hypothetical protein